jgi:hypothetical protein
VKLIYFKKKNMKAKNLFKGLLAATMFLLSSTLFAQTFVVTPVGGPESIDTVTIGSKMAYAIHPDNAITTWVNAGIFRRSGFNWVFSNALAVKSSADLAPNDSVPDGFYTDTVIHVTNIAPTVTVGTGFSVSVSERSRPKSGTGCTGIVQTLNIFPVAVPTMLWLTSDTGYCGAVANTDLNVSLTGYGPWDVSYTVNGVPKTATLGNGGNRASANLKLTIAAADLTIVTPIGNSIVLTNVTDRFSRKSLSAIAGTVPATTLKIYSYPTPGTNAIQHLKNL